MIELVDVRCQDWRRSRERFLGWDDTLSSLAFLGPFFYTFTI